VNSWDSASARIRLDRSDGATNECAFQTLRARVSAASLRPCGRGRLSTKWKQTFDRDPADRKGSGVRRYQIVRQVDEPNFVMVDLEFDRLADSSPRCNNSGMARARPSCTTHARIADVCEVTDI
jgi:hypothetical protein